MRIYDQNVWGNYNSENRIANRNSLIVGLIHKYLPDICCFQECNPSTSRAGDKDIQLLLKDQYEEACPEKSKLNFTPVFYRRDTIKLIENGYVLFEGLNDRNSKSFTWALLEEISSGKRMIAVSFHFWWKWESEIDELQRCENARVINEYCKELKSKYGVPVILCGDLNSGINAHQGDNTYREMLCLGMIDAREVSAETTDMLTAHAYPILNEEGIYVNGGMPIKTLDYVFLCGDSTLIPKSFSVITEQNALDSSDHSPLIFDFNL